MKGLERLKVIRKKSLENLTWIHNELFRVLRYKDIWILAHENINKNGLRHGFKVEKISLETLGQIQEAVLCEQYTFISRKVIKKTIKNTNLMTRLFFHDQIVQEVIRLILNAIYEPLFDSHSYAFREKKNNHLALQFVEENFNGITWIIKPNLEQKSPTINRNQLYKFLSNKINDSRFINLIRKVLNSELFEGKLISSSSGEPFTLVSILVNIYYHEFDLWVQKKQGFHKTSFDKSKKIESHISFLTKELKDFSEISENYNKKLKLLKNIILLHEKTRSQKKRGIEFCYIRYGYDWLIGIAGNYELTEKIKQEIEFFFDKNLIQKSDPKNIKIINLYKGKVSFIGYEIFFSRNNALEILPQFPSKLQTNSTLKFDICMDHILNNMVNQGYIIRNEKGLRPISKANHSTLADHMIVNYFRSVYLDLENYYSGCTYPKRLQYLYYLLHMSCAMTLGQRHRVSSKEILSKYGKKLIFRIPNTNEIISFPCRNKWPNKNRNWKINTIPRDCFLIDLNLMFRSD
jgi:hypothetical protein